MRKVAAENAKLFTDNDIKTAAAIYAEAPGRRTHKYKDPRGFAEFARMLSEHSALGHALTLQDKRAEAAQIYARALDLSPPSALRSAILNQLVVWGSPIGDARPQA